MTGLRVLIVDDEPLARRRIRALCDKEEDVRVVGECANGREAVDALVGGEQDVVFLDIRMPDMNGFEVLETVGLDALPLIVFVTAHGDHALEAFEARAVDYLLKPFEDERFRSALDRVRQLAPGAVENSLRDELSARLRELVESERARPADARKLVVRSGGRTTLLAPDEIRWIEADGSYVRLHTGEQRYLLRESMSRIEETLVDRGFLRIHRSSIVRLAEVRELRKYLVVLRDGTQLRVSERHWSGLRRALGM